MKTNQKSEKVKARMCMEGGNKRIKTSADNKKVGVSAGCGCVSYPVKGQTTLLKFLSKSKEGLRKISLKPFCQKADSVFFSFSLPAVAAAPVSSQPVSCLLSPCRGSRLLALRIIICTPNTFVSVSLSEIQCKCSWTTSTVHSLSQQAAIDLWLLHTVSWGWHTGSSQPATPGHWCGWGVCCLSGTGRTLLSCFSKQLFGLAFQQQWHLSSSSSCFFSNDCSLCLSSLWWEELFARRCWLVWTWNCKLLPGHPEIPATLMSAQAVLARAQLSASYLSFSSSVPGWHHLPRVTRVIGGISFFLHSSVAAAYTQWPQLAAAHSPSPAQNLKLGLLSHGGRHLAGIGMWTGEDCCQVPWLSLMWSAKSAALGEVVPLLGLPVQVRPWDAWGENLALCASFELNGAS